MFSPCWNLIYRLYPLVLYACCFQILTMNTLPSISSEEVFIQLDLAIMKKRNSLNSLTFLSQFNSVFGICPIDCTIVWNRLSTLNNKGGCPHHLLWSLLLVKIHGSESVQSALIRCHEETFWTFCWRFIYLLIFKSKWSKKKRFNNIMWYITVLRAGESKTKFSLLNVIVHH